MTAEIHAYYCLKKITDRGTHEDKHDCIGTQCTDRIRTEHQQGRNNKHLRRDEDQVWVGGTGGTDREESKGKALCSWQCLNQLEAHLQIHFKTYKTNCFFVWHHGAHFVIDLCNSGLSLGIIFRRPKVLHSSVQTIIHKHEVILPFYSSGRKQILRFLDWCFGVKCASTTKQIKPSWRY